MTDSHFTAFELGQGRGDKVTDKSIREELQDRFSAPPRPGTFAARNEAAERLHHLVICEAGTSSAEAGKVITEALAAERRATVERIREAVEKQASGGFDYIVTDAVRRILDEEAAR